MTLWKARAAEDRPRLQMQQQEAGAVRMEEAHPPVMQATVKAVQEPVPPTPAASAWPPCPVCR